MPSTCRHPQPYDLDNKLKNELETLGFKLGSAIPKSALIQIYQQLCKPGTRSESTAGNKDTNDTQTVSQMASSNQVYSLDTINSEVSIDTQTMNSSSSGNVLPGTVGVITTMQSTISSLQSTISILLTEKSSDKTSPAATPSNMLEKFYGTQVTAQTQKHPDTSEFRVSADDLPHVDVVSETIRKIIKGKYIYNVSTNESNGIQFLRQGRRDHRLDRVLTITQFYKAFGIYKRTKCEVFPQCRLELDLYEAEIGNIYEHYGDVFYQYHCQFTRKAAAYLEKA